MENQNNLDFSNFHGQLEKISKWRHYAKEIEDKLALENVGLIADTGTGKTIMTFILIKSLKVRTLFLAPTVVLTEQHAELYKFLKGKDVTVLNGKTSTEKRDWKKQLVIATPHVFMSEFKKNLVSEDDFDLVIFDEGHKAQGSYPYVPIASIFRKMNKKILALSASPGTNLLDIKKTEKIYGISSWVTAEIKMPSKSERMVKISLNKELEEASKLLSSIQEESLQKLDKLIQDNSNKKVDLKRESFWLTQQEIDILSQTVNQLPKPAFYSGKKELAKVYKVSHLYRLLITENYYSFIDRIKNFLAKDKAKSAISLMQDQRLKESYFIIKKADNIHPKDEELLKLAREYAWKGKSMLVFSNNKRSANYLKNTLSHIGYGVDTLFGGKDKSLKKQRETINAFKNGDITIIIATSVVEEGFSLPEVGVVVHYSQPQTAVQRLQRGGRTARFHQGYVCFLVMDKTFELSSYFAIRAKMKKMKEIFYPSVRNKKREKKIQKSKLIDQKNGQLSLFDEVPF
jgi:Fanconi anemia group M protein